MPPSLTTIAAPIIEYPSCDGQPMAETGQHVLLMAILIVMLRDHYRHRQDVYVIGNIFLYWEEGNPARRRSPDIMVIKGVPSLPERLSFKTWEERANPSVVFELTSDSTREEDLGPKMELYQQLRVREYFLYDPFGDYLPRRLMGYRLISRAENGDEPELLAEYEELPAASDGSLVSAELGLRLVPAGELLELVDLRTGQHVPFPAEYRARFETSQQLVNRENKRAEQERQRAEQEKLHAEEERKRADQERRRAEQEKLHAEEERKRADLERQRAEQEKLHAEQERQRAEQEKRHAEQERQRAEQEKRHAEQEKLRAEQLHNKVEQLELELARLRNLLSPKTEDRKDDNS
jgi:Uma2 family endonuclease